MGEIPPEPQYDPRNLVGYAAYEDPFAVEDAQSSEPSSGGQGKGGDPHNIVPWPTEPEAVPGRPAEPQPQPNANGSQPSAEEVPAQSSSPETPLRDRLLGLAARATDAIVGDSDKNRADVASRVAEIHDFYNKPLSRPVIFRSAEEVENEPVPALVPQEVQAVPEPTPVQVVEAAPPAPPSWLQQSEGPTTVTPTREEELRSDVLVAGRAPRTPEPSPWADPADETAETAAYAEVPSEHLRAQIHAPVTTAAPGPPRELPHRPEQGEVAVEADQPVQDAADGDTPDRLDAMLADFARDNPRISDAGGLHESSVPDPDVEQVTADVAPQEQPGDTLPLSDYEREIATIDPDLLPPLVREKYDLGEIPPHGLTGIARTQAGMRADSSSTRELTQAAQVDDPPKGPYVRAEPPEASATEAAAGLEVRDEVIGRRENEPATEYIDRVADLYGLSSDETAFALANAKDLHPADLHSIINRTDQERVQLADLQRIPLESVDQMSNAELETLGSELDGVLAGKASLAAAHPELANLYNHVNEERAAVAEMVAQERSKWTSLPPDEFLEQFTGEAREEVADLDPNLAGELESRFVDGLIGLNEHGLARVAQENPDMVHSLEGNLERRRWDIPDTDLTERLTIEQYRNIENKTPELADELAYRFVEGLASLDEAGLARVAQENPGMLHDVSWMLPSVEARDPSKYAGLQRRVEAAEFAQTPEGKSRGGDGTWRSPAGPTTVEDGKSQEDPELQQDDLEGDEGRLFVPGQLFPGEGVGEVSGETGELSPELVQERLRAIAEAFAVLREPTEAKFEQPAEQAPEVENPDDLSDEEAAAAQAEQLSMGQRLKKWGKEKARALGATATVAIFGLGAMSGMLASDADNNAPSKVNVSYSAPTTPGSAQAERQLPNLEVAPQKEGVRPEAGVQTPAPEQSQATPESGDVRRVVVTVPEGAGFEKVFAEKFNLSPAQAADLYRTAWPELVKMQKNGQGVYRVGADLRLEKPGDFIFTLPASATINGWVDHYRQQLEDEKKEDNK